MTRSTAKQRLLQTIRSTVNRHSMIEPASGIVVAVSGGPDSVALLHLLHELKQELSLRLVAAHLDHGLRARSVEEAHFVRAMADTLGISVKTRRFAVQALARKQGVSMEEAGRRARYAFFEEVRDSVSAQRIATAHHRDDELETFFLRVFRGSSLTGLRGIPPVRGRIIRPLIEASRADILRFLEEEHIPYKIDPTNLQAETDRNFIRNRVFPILRERFPDFREPFARTLELVAEEEEFLDRRAAEVHARSVSSEKDRLIIALPELVSASDVLAARVILSALYEHAGPEIRWTRTHLEAILKIIHAENPSARLDLPGGLVIHREYDRLILSTHVRVVSPALLEILVEGPGTVEIPDAGLTLSFRLIHGPVTIPADLDGRTTALFDADKVPFPLTIRSPRPGDRIRPWGMKGTRKLKDLLIDLKVPVRKRSKIALLVKNDTILWIPGIRRSTEAPILEETRNVLFVSMI